MRRLGLILIILCCLGLYIANSKAFSKIKLNLDNSIAVAFLNKDMILVVDDEDEATLLVLNKAPIINLNYFIIKS